MKTSEKYLYHQIHPLKLLTDITSGFLSLYPLWRHNLRLALLIMLVPPPIASAVALRFFDLEPNKKSALGRYVAKYMTHRIEAIRLTGMAIMAVGAWYRSFAAIVLGIGVVLYGWTEGLLFRRR
jgi:hypothetical protein